MTVLCSCSTLHDPSETILGPDTPALERPAVGWHVGIMPIVVSDEFRDAASQVNSAPSHRTWAYVPDPEWQRSTSEEIVQALQQMNGVERVVFLPGADGRTLESVLDEAWDDKLDLVVRPVLTRRRCAHVRSNDAHVLAVIVWIGVFHAFTWGIADETFGSDTDLAVEFYSTGRGSNEPVITRDVLGHIECDLDDFQQGFNFVNVFITPSGLSPGHWEDIGNGLLPLSRRECQRELIRQMTSPEGVAKDLATEEQNLSKTIALIVGGTSSGGRAPRFADEDANRMRELLTSEMTPAPSAPRAVRTLIGSDATPDQVLHTLDDFVLGRARDADRVVVYLNARGLVDEEGTAWLSFGESDDSRLAVSEVVRRLNRLQADVLLVSTTSWTFPVEGLSGGAEPDPWSDLRDAPRVALLEACSVGEQPLEIESSRGSILAEELARTLTDPATDADSDGWISIAEIAAATIPRIRDTGNLVGFKQTPAIRGTDEILGAPFWPILPE